jgi:formylglycine-generating enzyme required for sulfatase activity
VNFVSLYDAMRFANWMNNGQPRGMQDTATTEDGAYSMTPENLQFDQVNRNALATTFLPSQNEWYKAAYFDSASGSYFDYPYRTNTRSVCAQPGQTPNTGNCNRAVNTTTAVGSYPTSVGPFGTLDQGGNVSEWTEAHFALGERILRGGEFVDTSSAFGADTAYHIAVTAEDQSIGFRLASIPEPSTDMLMLGGVLGLACSRARRPWVQKRVAR